MSTQEIRIDETRESKTNPRKSFDAQQLDELAESIRQHGVLQPVIARPNGKGFELVVGARRFRAAKKAGLETIPATVSALSDLEVHELQHVEKAQRADVDPYEEAEAYIRLHRDHGKDVDEIAARVGKSRATIYGCMKLAALDPKARALFAKHDVSPSTALLVARIPDPKLQIEAAKEIAEPHYSGDGPLSHRDAKDHVQEHYMLRLKGAPFDQADTELVPKAGSCAACTKRTGNQRELFADVSSADVCTDPPCFRAKADAAWRVKKAEAEAAGRKTLEGKAAQDAAHVYHDGTVSGGSGYVSLSDKCWDDPKHRTYGRLLPVKDRPPTTLCKTEGGQVVELLKHETAQKALRAAGHKFATSRTSSGTSATERRRVARQKAKRAALSDLLLPALQSAAEKADAKKLWRALLLGALASCWHEAAKGVAKRREIPVSKKGRQPWQYAGDCETAIATWAEKQSTRVVQGVVLELLAARGTEQALSGYGGDGSLGAICKALGVNLAALRASASKAVAAREAERKKKARKKPTAKKRGKKGTRTKVTTRSRKSSTPKTAKPQRKKASRTRTTRRAKKSSTRKAPRS